MIKCDKGNVEIHGTGANMLAELTTLVHALYYDVLIKDCDIPQEEAQKLILDAVQLGFKTHEQVKGEAAARIVEMLDKLKDILTRKDDE